MVFDYAVYFIVVSTFYFGLTLDLQNRQFSVSFQGEVTDGANGTNVEETAPVGVLNISTLGFTVALMQAILVYLNKIPFHLYRASLAIIKVRLYVERLPAEDAIVSTNQTSFEMSRHRVLAEPGSAFKKWRVLAYPSDFLNPDERYRYKQYQSLASVFLGDKYGELVFNLYHRTGIVRYGMGIVIVTSIPLLLLALAGVVGKRWLLIGIALFALYILHVLTFNYELFKKVLKSLEVQVITLLTTFGTFGFCDALSFDERAFLMAVFGFGFILFSAFGDARTRVKGAERFYTVFQTYYYIGLL